MISNKSFNNNKSDNNNKKDYQNKSFNIINNLKINLSETKNSSLTSEDWGFQYDTSLSKEKSKDKQKSQSYEKKRIK